METERANDHRRGRPREGPAWERAASLRLARPGERTHNGETLLSSRLRASGAETDLALAVRAEPARLADLVGPARELADLAISRLRRQAAEAGARVPCRKGCSACCRYLVPISPPEAFALADRVARLPPPRRAATEERFRLAAAVILSAAPSLKSPATTLELSRWYWGLRLDCPLLAAGACGNYSGRPLACREHFVTGSAGPCAEEASSKTAHPLPLSLTHALCRAAAMVEGTSPESIMLPLALQWAEAHSERRHRTYPAADLAEAFIQAVQSPAALAA